jgi:TonB family protein
MGHLISDSLLRSIEQGILGLLLGLGAACILVFALRWRAVDLASAGVKPWRDCLEKALSDDRASRPSPSDAGLGEAGCADRLARVGLANPLLCADALEKLLDTQEARERALLERGASFLGTVGANAPFLGLTGTVLGILAAFRRMADAGGSGGVEVMSAIAGALIATAAGLVVAVITIDTSGAVTDVAIEKSAGPDFDGTVLMAVRAARYQAPVRNGRRVPARFRAPYEFRMERCLDGFSTGKRQLTEHTRSKR